MFQEEAAEARRIEKEKKERFDLNLLILLERETDIDSFFTIFVFEVFGSKRPNVVSYFLLISSPFSLEHLTFRISKNSVLKCFW